MALLCRATDWALKFLGDPGHMFGGTSGNAGTVWPREVGGGLAPYEPFEEVAEENPPSVEEDIS